MKWYSHATPTPELEQYLLAVLTYMVISSSLVNYFVCKTAGYHILFRVLKKLKHNTFSFEFLIHQLKKIHMLAKCQQLNRQRFSINVRLSDYAMMFDSFIKKDPLLLRESFA